MELKEQLTSLELSKRLKELGVRQDSFYHWSENNNIVFGLHGHYKDHAHSAFSVAELSELLPESIEQIGIGSGTLRIEKDKYGDWSIAYVGTYICTESEKLTDTMAKILIYLYGNKLIKK